MINREYRGYKYRVMHTINDRGVDEYYIAIPRWSLYSWLFRKPKPWVAFTYEAFSGPIVPQNRELLGCTGSGKGSVKSTYLHCWTLSEDHTVELFVSLVDKRLESESNRLKSEAHVDHPVPITDYIK